MDDKATDRRLRKTYGISLSEYNAVLASQNGVCRICGKPPKEGGKRLHVDHSHAWKKVKITFDRPDDPDGLWYAEAVYNGKTYTIDHWNKRQASKILKASLRRASFRGLLDWPCNRALQAFRDRPELLEAAAQYLRDFHKNRGILITEPKKTQEEI